MTLNLRVAIILSDILHIISFSRPPMVTPSSAVGVTWTVSPWGLGNFPSGSMPSSSYMLAMRSQGYTGRSFTCSPFASEAPTTRPPLKPPPASTAEKTCPQCPRPPFQGASHMTFGVLPNSPLHQMMVLSSRPRSDKSCKQGGHCFIHFRQFPAHDLEMLFVRIPAFVVDGDKGNAFFDQAPRHQAGLPERVAAIAVSELVFLLGEIEQFAGVAQNQVIGLFFGCSQEL